MLLLGYWHIRSLLLHHHRFSKDNVVLVDRVQKFSFIRCGED